MSSCFSFIVPLLCIITDELCLRTQACTLTRKPSVVTYIGTIMTRHYTTGMKLTSFGMHSGEDLAWKVVWIVSFLDLPHYLGQLLGLFHGTQRRATKSLKWRPFSEQHSHDCRGTCQFCLVNQLLKLCSFI